MPPLHVRMGEDVLLPSRVFQDSERSSILSQLSAHLDLGKGGVGGVGLLEGRIDYIRVNSALDWSWGFCQAPDIGHSL